MVDKSLDVTDAYKAILESDEEIARDARKQIRPTVELCDQCLSYLLSHLRGIEKVSKDWETDRGFRLAMAMLNHSFNHLLAARAVVLRGYTPEVFLLLRESLDAAAKAHLFHNSLEYADRYRDGKQIRAGDVRKAIKKMYLEEGEKRAGERIRAELWRLYDRFSKLGHANIDALNHRVLGPDEVQYAADRDRAIADAIGKQSLRGGIKDLFLVGYGLQDVARQALLSVEIVLTFSKGNRDVRSAEVQDLLDKAFQDRAHLQAAARARYISTQ